MIETHHSYTQKKPGRKNLGHLTRSAVVMLCAAWERYNEDLLLESISYLSMQIDNVSLLNKGIKKTISEKVKDDINEIKPIELAGEGWKIVWLNYAEIETKLLHTPKANKLALLFKRYMGIDDYLAIWKPGTSNKVDAFVSDRGAIAHNGNRTAYITMAKLRKYQDLIVENVIEIDSRMALELKEGAGVSTLPWQQDYSKDLTYYKESKKNK